MWPYEQACIREAADTLLFCRDLDGEDARAAFSAAATLTDRLIDAGRWTSSGACRLLDDGWACGPGRAMLDAVPACRGPGPARRRGVAPRRPPPSSPVWPSSRLPQPSRTTGV